MTTCPSRLRCACASSRPVSYTHLDVYKRQALERQQAAAARNRLFIQARQAQLRANLLRAVSHDLRTPLTSISGNASILMGGPELLDEKKKQQLYTCLLYTSRCV